MLKSSGSLIYTAIINGAGGTFAIDATVDNDDAGNHFDVTKLVNAGTDPATLVNRIKAWFQPTSVSNAGDPSKCLLGISVSSVDNILTAVTVTMTNNSPLVGDSVVGRLYIEIPQAANFAL